MNKRWMKLVALMTSLVICMGLLGACASSNGNNGSAGEASADPEKQAEVKNVLETGKFSEPVKMDIVRQMTSDVKFRSGEDINNNPHVTWAKETFNIDLNYVWTADSSSIDTKIRLLLSANEDLPDIVQYRGSQDVVDALIDSGKFVEVGDLFEQYASESYKSAMAEDASVWNPYVRDGKKYAIPVLDYSNNNDTVLWIRDDWMKKYNLQAPATIEDMEKMMEIFANEDPDGNGKKDTVGLAVGLKNGMNTWGLADADFIFGAYGVMPAQWNADSDGKLAYGSIQPAVKTVLGKLKDWMDKGYIHKEAGLHDEGKAAELFSSGKAGIVAAPYWAGGWPLPAVKEVDKNADYSAYPLPAGPDGHIGRSQSGVSNGVVLINKNFEHPEAFFLYANYLYDNQGDPQAGSPLEYGFEEGYDYLIKDGQPTWDPAQFPEDKPIMNIGKYTLLFDGARIPSLVMKTMNDLDGGKEPETAFEKRSSMDMDKNIHGGAVNFSQIQYAMPNLYNGSPTKTYKKRWDFLSKSEKETFNKIIYGESPIDAFDTYVAQWKSSGGDTITDEINEWYDSVKTNE
ncbi:extracellular solute-binding protein [Candidatus Pristimantibacillus sp. PTI5]|uniref:extracellular solute-binding protein n=1 Tax=Candidatus Pristimantibacillus sp. PTI5 TaxID=3400422 RepID=UPI003B019EF1